MRLKKVKLLNFRGYGESEWIDFDAITALVGKNNVGKSTILDALDVFFNESEASSADVNINADRDEFEIHCAFECDKDIVVDESVPTNLKEELVLNKSGLLDVYKRYAFPKKSGSAKIEIGLVANYPICEEYKDVFVKTQHDLQTMAKKLKLDGSLTENVAIRKAIRQHFGKLLKERREVEISLSNKDGKRRWDGVCAELPIYELFKADRTNDEKDTEIQNPIRGEIKKCLGREDVKAKLREITDIVNESVKPVLENALAKMKEMDSPLVTDLKSEYQKIDTTKWADAFKGITLKDAHGISIGKHGSGMRRMFLLNFFRASADRKRTAENDERDMIYAIEEPETAQHCDFQRMLINALGKMTESPHNQVILTTHSAIVVAQLGIEKIRLLYKKDGVVRFDMIEQCVLTEGEISTNEVNYLVFGECGEAYHDELFAYLVGKESPDGRIPELFKTMLQPKKLWKRDDKPVIERDENYSLSYYVRNYMHHSNTKLNDRYTSEELKVSIRAMRSYISKTYLHK